VLLVAPLQPQLGPQERIAAGGIDEMPRVPGFAVSVIVDGVHTHAPAALQDLEGARTASFDDLGARACGTPDENLVEIRTSDLIRIRQGLVPGLRKLEFLAPSVGR
jgi:hypothetical protein